MKKLISIGMAIAMALAFTIAMAPAQANSEPPPDTAGAWIIYPDSTPDHWVGNDRHSDVWGSDLSTSIHEALGYSGQLLYPGPDNDDIGYWEFYNPPPEGSIIELRGGTGDTSSIWDIGGDGAQGGQGREKMKSLVVQQNGITIRGQDYDDGIGNMVQQEILFNNGGTTALFYLEASDLTIENLHISGTWPSNSGGYALAVGRYTLIGPDPNATGLAVTGNNFNNLRAMFDEQPTVADLTVVDNVVEDTYYNIFKKGVTFTGDSTITGNTFNHVGEGKTYSALQVLGHTSTTCIDYNTFNGWASGQYAIEVENDISANPIGIGTNNVFVDQVGGSGAGYEMYPLASGGHAVGATSQSDITGCGGGGIEEIEVVLFNGDEILGDPHKVQISGSGDYTTGDTIPLEDLPANGRLHRGGVYGDWQAMDPANDDGTDGSKLELEFATVHVTLYNDKEDDGIQEADWLNGVHKVEVSGVGDFTTCDTFHVPPTAKLSYRLHRGGVYGDWHRDKTFPAGYTDWQLEFATVHVTLYNDEDDDGIQDGDKLKDMHKVEVPGVGDFTTCDTFHVPPTAKLSYRLHRGGVYGDWHRNQTFPAGYTDWQLEFATVHVTLYNDKDDDGIQDGDKLNGLHKVEVSGVGDFTTCDTFHVPPTAKLSYRLHRGGVYGDWHRDQTFPAGYTDWQLEFATVHVTLYNDKDDNGIQDVDKLNGVHKVEVPGVGDFTTCDTFHVPPTAKLSYRLHRGGVYGDWHRNQTFPAGYTDWQLEFATVHVVIYGPCTVEVSGVGDFTTCDTFHVAPTAKLSYRLHRGGIYYDWHRNQTFPAGYTDWELDCPVEVVLFNDTNGNGKIDTGEKINAPHKVQVSGSGDYQTGDTIPWRDLPAKGRLHSGGIYGLWQTLNQANDDGTDACKLELEFATVHVTLYNDGNENGEIEEGEKLKAPHKVQVSGAGDFITCDTFHVPPDTNISYRLHSGGIYGGWQKRTFSAGYEDWQLEFATVHITLYNDSNENNEIDEGEKLYDPHKVQVSGSGDYKTCDIFHVPPNTNISYRLHSGGIYGGWQKRTFSAGYEDWQLEFATVHVTLYNDSNGNNQIEETEKLKAPHKVQVSGSGDYITCTTFHVPPDTNISYRLHSGGIYGPWQKRTFSAGYEDWELEFATVHVTLYNDSDENGVIDDGEKLDAPHRVQVSGVGDFTTCDTFHVPPGTNISYRLHSGGIYGGWEKRTFQAGFTEWELQVQGASAPELEFATVHVTVYNDENGTGAFDDGEELTDPHKVQVSGVGDFTTCDTFHVPPNTNISYRLHSGGIYGGWQKREFDAGKTVWELEFATVHVTLHNDGVELSDPHKVQVSGSGDYTTCNTFHVPPDTNISYRLHSGGIYGGWQKRTFSAGYEDWQLEFATVHVTLYNDSDENNQIEEAEKLGDPHKVQVSGSGDYITCNTFHVPPDTNISYRLHSGGIYGGWQKRTFSVGYEDWQLEFATVHVTLHNAGVELGDPHKVQVSGSGDYKTCDTFHVPPDANISYRLHSGGIYGGWQKRTFSAGYEDWQLEFATVHVVVHGPGSVQVSGSGNYKTCDTFHVPPDTNISYRLRCCGIYEGWQKRTFPAGKTEWDLECPVEVVLYNDSNGNGKIDAGEKLDDTHKVEVSGSGDYATGDTIPWSDLPASSRLHSGGIYGPWQTLDPTKDGGTSDCKLELEFATVHVTLYNDSNENGDIEEGEELSDGYQVEVSGVGELTTSNTFHVPPGQSIQYRLLTTSIAGPWQYTKFTAGYTEWQLEFATVHVTLYNDSNGDDKIEEGEKLSDDYQVEVSGVGKLTNCNTFHVPPGQSIQYRLLTTNIAGPWQYTKFTAGYTEWELEFATVHVTLYNDSNENGDIEEGEKLSDDYQVEVSGVGKLTNCNTFHVPPGQSIQYRLCTTNIAGPWQYTKFTAGNTEWQLEFATVHVTLYNDEDDLLSDGYEVEVSGVGKLTTCDTFHVPPGQSIQYRLLTTNIAGPWQYTKFTAGYTDWELEFATVHVTLPDGYEVEVSGVGKLTDCNTFHVPPGQSIQYRLITTNIVGPWQYTNFTAGYTDWTPGGPA